MHPHLIYEATKSSIQQGIFDLQEKMRRKNQLDLERELAENLINEERILRQEKQYLDMQRIYADNVKYNKALLGRTACDPYANSVLYDSALNDPSAFSYLELKETIRREAEQLEYLKKLERLKEQSLALESRATNGYRAQMSGNKLANYSSPIQEFSSTRNSPGQSRHYDHQNRSPSRPQRQNNHLQYDNPLEEDSSALLEKYSKGIRAQEYNRDMERLIEIQKRLRKVEEKPSAAKSYVGDRNQSIVVPYQQPKREWQRQRSPGKANILVDRQLRGVVPSAQRNQDTHQQYPKQEKKVQIFQNQKIGQVINKRKPQQKQKHQPQTSDDLEQKYPALDKLDAYIKKAQNRNPLIKPVSLNRPYTSKSRNAGQRQVSRSMTSAISPLKSDRAHNSYSMGKTKRQRAKSSTKYQQNSSRTHNNINASIRAKQANSRLLALDPETQKIFQEILRKQINEKIQNRLQLLTCVFKDVKLRQERNQIEALMHRFEIEAKARRQVKTMINNDPKILKKHKMVVG